MSSDKVSPQKDVKVEEKKTGIQKEHSTIKIAGPKTGDSKPKKTEEPKP
jgi:hypothetical protein